MKIIRFVGSSKRNPVPDLFHKTKENEKETRKLIQYFKNTACKLKSLSY